MDNFKCPNCGKMTTVSKTEFTYDIMGIPYRRVCNDCYEEIMNNRGYDGRDYRNDCCEQIF